MRRVLQPTFSNEYFLINGDFGTGKTRTLVELIRRQLANEGQRKEGAPIYVLALQGKEKTNNVSLIRANRFALLSGRLAAMQ